MKPRLSSAALTAAVVAAVSAVSGFTLAYASAHRAPEQSLSDSTSTMRYVARWSPTAGREMIMVFVGSSTCQFSNAPSLPRTIDSLKMMLRDRAIASGHSFAVVGVAKDRSLAAGLGFLTKFGPFEEIAAGHAWANSSLTHLVFGAQRGPAATPQVIVLERELGGADVGRASRERFLMRKVGLRDIESWLAAGAPVPRS